MTARLRTMKAPTKLGPPINLGNHCIELSTTGIVVIQRLEASKNEKLLIELTPIEAQLFKLLITKPHTLLTEQELLCSLQECKKNHQLPQGIDRHINALRGKLADSGLYIHRVVGVGWLISNVA